MTSTVLDAEIGDYVDRCEPHLADLPERARVQLRDDIAQIVAEVAAELDGAPDDLVGPPLRFVTELRAAAGLPAPPTALEVARPNRRGLLNRLGAAWSHRATRWVRDLLPQLRPAWWIGRAVLLAVGLAYATGTPVRPEWIGGLVPCWPIAGSRLLGLAVTGAATYVSVEAGRRSLRGPGRVARGAATVLAVVVALHLVGEVRTWAAEPGAGRYVVTSEVGPPGWPGATTVAPYPNGHGGRGFAPVVIGSDLTGQSRPVIDLPTAKQLAFDMQLTSPPAAIWVDDGGGRTYPGNGEDIAQLLDDLARSGMLSTRR